MKRHIDIDDYEPFFRMLVKAIQKGRGEDLRFFFEHREMATYNSAGFYINDSINTDICNMIRDMVSLGEVRVHIFSRGNWKGVLLAHMRGRFTLTYMSKQRFNDVIREPASQSRHYLRSLLYKENQDRKPLYQSEPLFDDSLLGTDADENAILAEYEHIVGDIPVTADFVHLVLVYAADGNQITELSLKLLTPNFEVSEEYSLMHLLQPDFNDLTAESNDTKQKKDVHRLLKPKKRKRGTTVVSVKKGGKRKQS